MSAERDLIVEVERTWAQAERRIVDVVARLDPGRGSITFDLADGIAVLAGPGLFVNQVMGAGLSAPVTSADLEQLERGAAEVGVPAAFDVCEATDPAVTARLRERGYAPDDTRLAVVHDLADSGPPSRSFTIDFVGEDELGEWQAATAAGWGHVEADRRAASDLFAAAAAEVDDPGLLLARDDDGEVVGAAMLRIEGEVATLGGMSTRPEARGRGVQSALVLHRLQRAADAGCRVATSSVAPGSGSYRNLTRLGFRTSHSRTTWVRT